MYLASLKFSGYLPNIVQRQMRKYWYATETVRRPICTIGQVITRVGNALGIFESILTSLKPQAD